MGGQRFRLIWGRAAEAGVGQEEGALLLLLLLEAVLLDLSVQTVPLLLGHASKLHSCVQIKEETADVWLMRAAPCVCVCRSLYLLTTRCVCR